MLDNRGKFRRATLIRALVSIPCPPDEPYRDVVDFTFVPEEWDAPTPLARTEDEPPALLTKTKSNVRYQAMAVLAIGAALVVGEAASGIVSDTWKKAQGLMDRIDGVNEKTRRDPPTHPPLFISD